MQYAPRAAIGEMEKTGSSLETIVNNANPRKGLTLRPRIVYGIAAALIQ